MPDIVKLSCKPLLRKGLTGIRGVISTGGWPGIVPTYCLAAGNSIAHLIRGFSRTLPVSSVETLGLPPRRLLRPPSWHEATGLSCRDALKCPCVRTGAGQPWDVGFSPDTDIKGVVCMPSGARSSCSSSNQFGDLRFQVPLVSSLLIPVPKASTFGHKAGAAPSNRYSVSAFSSASFASL